MSNSALKSHLPLMSLPKFLLLAVILPLALLLALDYVIVTWVLRGSSIGFLWIVGLVLVPKILLIPWVGGRLMRYVEAHFAQFGSNLVKLILFVSLPLFILVVVINTMDTIQTVVSLTKKAERVVTPKVPEYQFSLNRETGEYQISGIIDFGITRDFRVFIAQNPGGRIVVLNSVGGSIYEGRGLAALFSEQSLETLVIRECSSACTLAYIGGVRRALGVGGRLGFHQYGLSYRNAHQKTPFFDPLKEQQRDQAEMVRQGIDAQFISRIFEKPNDEIWFPEPDFLFQAGVVHTIN